jgi:hypothetical protein
MCPNRAAKRRDSIHFRRFFYTSLSHKKTQKNRAKPEIISACREHLSASAIDGGSNPAGSIIFVSVSPFVTVL